MALDTRIQAMVERSSLQVTPLLDARALPALLDARA
jgi:hypothetical protein